MEITNQITDEQFQELSKNITFLNIYNDPYNFPILQTPEDKWQEQYFHSAIFNSQIFQISYYSSKIKNPKGVIFFIHGMNQNMDSWRHLIKPINQMQLDVYGIDQDGQGQSSGQRGVCVDFNFNLQYHIDIINRIKYTYPNNTKFFIMGLSFGGCLSLRIQEYIKFNGMLLMSPALKINENNNYVLQKIVRHFGLYLNKLKIKPIKYQHQNTCRNVKYMNRKNIIKNEYLYPISVYNIMKGVDSINYSKINTKYFLIQGGMDSILDVREVFNFKENVKCKGQVIINKDFYHDVLQEPGIYKYVQSGLEYLLN